MKILSHTTKSPTKRQHLEDGIRKIDPGIEISFFEEGEEVRSALENVEIFLTYNFERDWWIGEKSLRWVHIGGSGINHILFPELIESNVIVTNSRGIHGKTMAEYALAVMLRFTQRFDLAESWRQHRNWREAKLPMTRNSSMLVGKNVGVIGAGEVGSAVGKLCKAVGMCTFGLTSAEKPKPDWADKWGTITNLPELLKWSDFIILSLPGVDGSRKLIGKVELEMMKKSAFILNFARGGIIDESAIINALDNEIIAGACLDVFENEPLPEDSPLFSVKNLFITPHIAGNYPQYTIDVLNLFLENLKSYLDGMPLKNIVDLKRGY